MAFHPLDPKTWGQSDTHPPSDSVPTEPVPEPVYDGNGNLVLPTDWDYPHEKDMQDAQRNWEARIAKATPEKQAFWHRIESDALFIARMYESDLLSPRAKRKLWNIVNSYGLHILPDEHSELGKYIARKIAAEDARVERRLREEQQQQQEGETSE